MDKNNESTLKLKIKIPSTSDKGFFKRQKQFIAYHKSLAACEERSKKEGLSSIDLLEINAEMLDLMIDFILQFVEEPTDKEEARELVSDLSKDEIDFILSQVSSEKKEENPLSKIKEE